MKSSISLKKRKRRAVEGSDTDESKDFALAARKDEADSGSNMSSSNNNRPADPDAAAPRVAHGIVEFRLSSLVVHFTCSLCQGLFKDPVTITECLHSFCKSCLYGYYSRGHNKCPTCEVYLGPDPFKYTLNDRTLQSLGDKVLFPDVKERDEAEERAFYASRGIPPKPEETEPAHAAVKPAPVVEVGDEIELLLVPDHQADDQHELPKLERSCLRTSGRLKIGQLKKYLLRMLDLPSARHSYVEIVCNGNLVGNELSLHFIKRTMWPTTEQMRLLYRFSEDLLL